MRAKPRQSALIIIPALFAGLLLAGCSADGGGESTNSAAIAPQKDAAAGGEVAAGPGMALDQAEAQKREGPGQDTPAQAPDLGIDQRSIIYRGSVTVRVKDVNVATGQTTGIATTAGGFVGSDNRSRSSEGAGTATMQLRIPADKFAAAVDQLSNLGHEENREINTEDVTEQTVDLDARITVQQARVDSGRRLLAQAKTLNDLVMLEKEVATREADLASLQAKKRRLADLTALSTITVTFLGPAAPASSTNDDPDGFLGGLSAGWDALLVSLKVLLTVLGALLPWIIAIGLPVWGLIYLYRRFRRDRPGGHPALVTAGAPMPASGPYASPPRPATAGPSAPAEKTDADPAAEKNN
jgi:uncharacterized protein DUF4349